MNRESLLQNSFTNLVFKRFVCDHRESAERDSAWLKDRSGRQAARPEVCVRRFRMVILMFVRATRIRAGTAPASCPIVISPEPTLRAQRRPVIKGFVREAEIVNCVQRRRAFFRFAPLRYRARLRTRFAAFRNDIDRRRESRRRQPGFVAGSRWSVQASWLALSARGM